MFFFSNFFTFSNFMQVFLSVCLLIFLLIFLAVMLFAISHQFYYSFNPRRMVLFPTFLDKVLKNNLTTIIDKYCLGTQNIDFLEIGCGTAHTAHFVAKSWKWRQVSGVEVDFLTFQLAKLTNYFAQTKIKLVKADIFDYDFPEGSVLYCYLGPKIMRELYKMGKFQNCLVISLTFSIENCQETQNIVLPNSYHRFLIYDFRQK